MQVWLADSQSQRLTAAAAKTGCTKSSLAREAIELMLDEMDNRARTWSAVAQAGLTFEGFTVSARLIIARAEKEAYKLCRNAIGSEHLLLGLFGDPLAEPVLEKVGITHNGALRKIQILEGLGNDVVFDKLVLTVDCDQCLRRARRTANQFQDSVVDSVHIMLALLEQYKAGAYNVFEAYGIDRDALKNAVLQLKPRLPPKKRRKKTTLRTRRT